MSTRIPRMLGTLYILPLLADHQPDGIEKGEGEQGHHPKAEKEGGNHW